MVTAKMEELVRLMNSFQSALVKQVRTACEPLQYLLFLGCISKQMHWSYIIRFVQHKLISSFPEFTNKLVQF